MVNIFINLKRFDVPVSAGGICPEENPVTWIKKIISETINNGIGKMEEVRIVYLLPEALIPTAVKELENYSSAENYQVRIGSQGVYRENIKPGGNFGAFTTNLPAAAAVSLGCSWTIIGHSEERKDKLGILTVYDQSITEDTESGLKASAAVNRLINEEIKCASESGLKILLCVGETAGEKGDGTREEQKFRTETVISNQLNECLKGVDSDFIKKKIVIGYEPIWAIGPGRTPPGSAYISMVSSFIKKYIFENFNCDCPVLYGGGLKEENAGEISGVETIDGGLVALTSFTGTIGFRPAELKKIILNYLAIERI